jgi:antitoxin (DNA-binding transcriptional repressor) of toxin-antitoxin stability system
MKNRKAYSLASLAKYPGLLLRVTGGEELIVTQYGVPMARLVPLPTKVVEPATMSVSDDIVIAPTAGAISAADTPEPEMHMYTPSIEDMRADAQHAFGAAFDETKFQQWLVSRGFA